MLIQSEISAEAEIVFDSIAKVVRTAGYSITKTDRPTYTIDVRVPMSWQSYGEKLTFTVEALDSGTSVIRVNARRVVFMNLTSHPDRIARRIIGYVEKECGGGSWIHDYRAQASIPVREVVSESTAILVKNPSLVLAALPFVLIQASISGVEQALLGQLTTASLLTIQGATTATLESIISGVLIVLSIAPYPPMIQTLLRGSGFSISQSLRTMLHRFRALLAVGILFGLVQGVITIAPPLLDIVTLLLLYPLLWYTYTIPAMMLEDKGPWKAMKASKAFGGNKKSSTFGLYLVLIVPGAVIFVITFLLSRVSSPLGSVA